MDHICLFSPPKSDPKPYGTIYSNPPSVAADERAASYRAFPAK
jgi:hypothetical protein